MLWEDFSQGSHLIINKISLGLAYNPRHNWAIFPMVLLDIEGKQFSTLKGVDQHTFLSEGCP
jgi:hypothetical protein